MIDLFLILALAVFGGPKHEDCSVYASSYGC